MRVADTNWVQLADYLTRDDRAIIPLGSTEPHAYLSLGIDAILAERVMENFHWNRVAAAPSEAKAMIDTRRLQSSPPAQVRELIGDGNYGGAYQKPDEAMLRIWQAAVDETRDMINGL